MFRRCLCILLSLMMLILSACTPENDALQMPDIEPIDWTQAQIGREIVLPLYYFTDEKTQLSVERRSVHITDQTRAQSAILALLEEPKSAGLISPFAASQYDKLELQHVQVSGKTANVDFYNKTGGSDVATVIMARTAVANTLISHLGVEYVNMYINGNPADYNGNRLGAMKYYEGSPKQYLEQVKLDSERMSYPATVIMTLYFPDAKYEYLICETREVIIPDSGGDLNKIIVSELLKGPQDTQSLVGITDEPVSNYEDFTLLSHVYQDDLGNNLIVDTTSGQKVSNRIEIDIGHAAADETLSAAAIVCSLMGYTPDMQSVSVSFGEGADIKGGDGLTRLSFADKIGTLITLYVPDTSHEKLQAYACAVKQDQSEDPEVILRELIDYAMAEGTLFPQDIEQGDLNRAWLCNDTAIVDFSRAFYDKCDVLGEKEEMLMVYSIVNTLTQIYGVKKVQVLFDGKTVEKLGVISVFAPLMQNPGIIS